MIKEKILIIAAHPDDEAIGCGGYIAKKSSQNAEIKAIFLTNGVSARDDSCKKDINLRKKSLEESSKILGIKEFSILNFPDNQLDAIPLINVIKEVEKVIIKFRPEIILTHHIGDLNIDHQITHKATITACRPINGKSVKQILSFEVLSSTEWQSSSSSEQFIPNYFVNITDFIDKKISSLKSYQEELRKSPHSRSLEAIKALAKLRGETSGYKYAESFKIIRQLND